MKNKKIIIGSVIFVIVLTTTIIIMLNKTSKMSKEILIKSCKDVTDFTLQLSESMTDMVSIMQDNYDEFVDENNQTVDLSKVNRFKEVKEKVIESCKTVNNYDVKGLSDEMVAYINYAKKIATETQNFFDQIDGELSINAYTELLNEHSNRFSDQMQELMKLNTEACLAYYNETSEDQKTFEEFQAEIMNNTEKI